MPYYKFGPDEIFHNQIKAYPPQQFWIYDKNVYYNNRSKISGAYVDSVPNAGTGYISLYEMNVDRPTGQLIYPFITKQGSRESFATVSTSNFNTDFAYGDVISGSYPLTATIVRGFYEAGTYDTRLDALRTTFDHYKVLNANYAISSSATGRNLKNISLNVFDIPSIFYGTSIKKGSIRLRFYHTGTLIAEARDIGNNGSLVDVGIPTGLLGTSGYSSFQPATSGSVVGFALYNEGFIFLTGSTAINAVNSNNYEGSSESPKWIYFGDYGDSKIPYVPGSTWDNPNSSYLMEFSGTTYTPVVTMFANAPKNAVNNSSNLSFLDYTQSSLSGTTTGSSVYAEPSIPIANVISSSFKGAQAAFQKTVYISQICIYDEMKNKIAVAKLAKPIKKSNDNDLTFKLKLDI